MSIKGASNTKRTQTTSTFKSSANAGLFRRWLLNNVGDLDYGDPRFHDLRQVSEQEWCVEYSYETDFARGVATGIDLA